MKNYQLLTNAMATVLLASAGFACTSDLDEHSVAASSDQIQFVSVVQSLSTRAATSLQESQIASGVQVGVFVASETDGESSTLYDNVALTADGEGALTGSTTMTWSAETLSFYAYAPYAAANEGALDGNIAFSVKEDQSTDANYTASDLLFGVPSVSNPVTKTTDGKVTLAFKHALSKVVITLKDNAPEDSKLAAPTVALASVATSGTMAAKTGVVTANAATGNVTVGKFTSDATDYSAAAVIVPQTVKGGVAFIQVTDNDKTYSCSLSADKEFAAGSVYKYTVTFNGNALAIETSSTLQQWEEGETEEELTPVESVSYTVGDYVLADGSLVKSSAVSSSDNVVGVIFSTKVSDTDAAAGYNAYVLSTTALSTAKVENTSNTISLAADYTFHKTQTEFINELDGLSQTKYVQASTQDVATDYPLFNLADCGLPTMASNFSQWFIPSVGQYMQILANLGGATIEESDSYVFYGVFPSAEAETLSLGGLTYSPATTPAMTTLLANLLKSTNNVEIFKSGSIYAMSTLYTKDTKEGTTVYYTLLGLKNDFNGSSSSYGDSWGFSAGTNNQARARVACAAAKLTLNK